MLTVVMFVGLVVVVVVASIRSSSSIESDELDASEVVSRLISLTAPVSIGLELCRCVSCPFWPEFLILSLFLIDGSLAAQPIDIIDFGNLVRHNIKNVHASTVLCCCLIDDELFFGDLPTAACCLLLPDIAANSSRLGQLSISALSISGPLSLSACFARTLNAGSTVLVELNVNFIPF